MNDGDVSEAKRRAGESAASVVADGMVVGLGTGSTAAYAIEKLGERVDAGLAISGIPTSYQSESLARKVGIPLTTLSDSTPDVAIDGADQVAGGHLVKGGGAAHAREKFVDAAADRVLVVVDPRKEVPVLDHPIPVEVLPDARSTVAASIRDLGGEPTLRSAQRKDGPVVTQHGNLVLDCDFGEIDEPGSLAETLSALPGVVEHGIFHGVADEIHVGTADGVTIREV